VLFVRWWDSRDIAFDDLVVGLQYFNEANHVARDFQKYGEMADALTAFARGYLYARNGTLEGFADDWGHAKEAAIVREFASDAFGNESILALMRSDATVTLANLQPFIYDEEAVDREMRHLNVRKDDLPPEVFTRARSVHRAFHSARQLALQVQSKESLRSASLALGRLMYLVRCNLVHPGKTRFGPDRAKAERDGLVVAIALPVLEAFLLAALDSPERRLAVYGSLRSDGENHQMIDDLGALVAAGHLRGTLAHIHGYPVITWDNSGSDVPFEIYESGLLTPRRWAELDAWEGINYRRIAVPIRLASSEHTIATIYANANS
jgi:gamma-glutamylcyclotransferase (GGCT)/AIG2-like uncharacterized protein YtfP